MTKEEQEAKDKADAEAKAKADADALAAKDVAYFQSEAKKAFDKRDMTAKELKDAQARLVDLEKAAKELDELKKKGMSDAEKTQARLKELEPLESEAKKYRDVFEKMLTAESEGLTDEQKALIPALPTTAEKVLWLREARAKGVFGKPISPIGDKLPGTHGGNVIKRSEFNALTLKEAAAVQVKLKSGEMRMVEG